MGWKGTLRSVKAEYKASQRRALAQHRQELAATKRAEKDHERAMAALDVEQYEYLLESLQSVHKVEKTAVQWEDAVSEPEPAKPIQTNAKETATRAKLIGYKPSFISKMLGREEKQKQKLADAVELAKEADRNDHLNELAAWERIWKEWEENRSVASAVLAGEISQQLKVLNEYTDLSDMDDVVCKVSWVADDSGILRAVVKVSGIDVVPENIKSLLASGKLSNKKMPAGRRNEIYQDYVCGCAIRIACEYFSLLPTEVVEVDVSTDMLNPSTGHIEDTLILSAFFVRDTIERLNLAAVDASDCLNNFVHRMQYSKTKGFAPTERCSRPSI